MTNVNTMNAMDHITRACERAAAAGTRLIAVLNRFEASGAASAIERTLSESGRVWVFDLEHAAELQTIPGVPTRS